jgi:ABC-2 type transport system permease protein
MSTLVAVVARELRLLLLAPTGAALLSVWTLCCGALFLMDLTAFEQAEQRALAIGDPALIAMLDVNDLLLGSVLGNVVVLFLFLAPLIAMRLFADDRPTRDWLVHASSPVVVAVGKLLAGLAVVGGLATSTLAFSALLALLGQPAVGSASPVVDVGQALCATATVVACAGCFVAVAAAVASAVDAPLAAGLLSFLVLVVWWLASGAESLVGPDVGRWLSWASPASHLERGLRGVVDAGDFAWFVGVVLAGAVGTVAGVDGAQRGAR